ncbi:ATP-binding protein [Brevibacillus migulae]|uniref:ATP-binding protein n=1 Tax=Brevibacillus migulae TaxID=1644114 RepID=UPI00106EBDE9|nr:ATP-binding protein [Brevibacillus migulae]
MRTYLYRIRFAASVLAVTIMPIIITGFTLLHLAENALLEEKQAKLIAITHQLDYALSEDFNSLLQQRNAQSMNRAQKIALLNQVLGPVTDQIARTNPGIGVGYYAAEWDAIVTYGPSSEMNQHVGKSIPMYHPGREVMRTGKMAVAVGDQVRGNIMNAMYPLIRNGKVIGYAWANELMSNIDVQLKGMRYGIYAIVGIGCLVAAAASGMVIHRLELILTEIKEGLRQLSTNLSFRMKRMRGEPGEIIDAINKLAEDLQASQSSLAQAKKLALIGELATSIAHEVRNPLTSIKAFTQIIEDDLPPNHDSREYTTIIIEEVERLNRFAEELLLFSRPSEEKHVPVSVQEVLQQTLVLLKPSFKQKELSVKQREQTSLPDVDASPELLKQVFLNILLNGIQAAPYRGQLWVELETRNERVMIHFYNEGAPIEEADQLSIFEPFFTTKKTGTGLGLSISQRIVQAYGGHITVNNERDGVQFTVTLPAIRKENKKDAACADCG